MARASAIKPSQQLSSEEVERLMSDLFKSATPNFTPDGKTIIATMPITEITKLF